ncbi:MAG: monovalent cation/H(+) antiporter subunit G [Rhodomicrobium sp.]|nr:monovalent cation/H(+) antiporter subunit G [Rhodomicrobium sp.]
MSETLIAILILAGSFFAVIAAIGVLRLPDVLIRMHASTKAGTLGCGLILLAVAIHWGSQTGVVVKALAAIAFLLVTAPVGAHMIGRAAYRTGVPLSDRMTIDALKANQPPE